MNDLALLLLKQTRNTECLNVSAATMPIFIGTYMHMQNYAQETATTPEAHKCTGTHKRKTHPLTRPTPPPHRPVRL